MEVHTLFVELLFTICLALNARCTEQPQFTKGIECSVENQNYCSVNPDIDHQTERVQPYQCFFAINVCVSPDNDVIFSYLPPLPEYGIDHGEVFLNSYVGQKNRNFDHFNIPLAPKKPCKLKDVLPGEYNISMRPIEPEDYDYTDKICDGVRINFASNTFVVKNNSSEYNETNETITTSGIISVHFANTNSTLDTTFTDSQEDSGSNRLISTQSVIIITVLSSSMVLVSLTVMLIVRHRHHFRCCKTDVAEVKHIQDIPEKKGEHEKGKETYKAVTCESGIGGWDTDGFLQSDVATLRERCGPTLVENGQNPRTPLYIDGYTKSEKRFREPSIYPAVTILSGTFEKTNYVHVHPLYEDLVCDSGYRGSWVPGSNTSANQVLSQNVYLNQNKQLSDITPSKQNQGKYESVINPNGVLSPGDGRCLRHTFPNNQVSMKNGSNGVHMSNIHFIPPDSTLSDCNDVTSRIIEQGMLEINRNYFRNISSVFTGDSHDTSTYNEDSFIPTSSQNQYTEEDMAQDASDISIGGISL